MIPMAISLYAIQVHQLIAKNLILLATKAMIQDEMLLRNLHLRHNRDLVKVLEVLPKQKK